MELSLEHPGDHLFIRSFGAEGIRIVDEWYQPPLILAPDRLSLDWPAAAFEDLDESALQAILEFEPEIVLLSSGERQKFLPPELMMPFYRKGVGIEVMTHDAACRTFKVPLTLVSTYVSGE